MLAKPDYEKDFRDYCENIVSKYGYKKGWRESVILSDLNEHEKNNLARLASLSQSPCAQYEMLVEHQDFDSVVSLFQAYLKDEDTDKAKEMLNRMSKNAFEYHSKTIEQQLNFALSEYRDSLGYITDIQIEQDLDVRDRNRDAQAYL